MNDLKSFVNVFISSFKINKTSFSEKHNFYIFATQFVVDQIFQIMNSDRLNHLCLQYKRFIPLGCKNIGIRVCGKESTPLCL